MTVQDTELTFTRCSSCRSLVPATAARCRMCGETLSGEPEGESSPASDELKKSRVRQRTMSVSQMEVEDARQLEAAAENLAPEPPSPEPPSPEPPFEPPAPEPPLFEASQPESPAVEPPPEPGGFRLGAFESDNVFEDSTQEPAVEPPLFAPAETPPDLEAPLAPEAKAQETAAEEGSMSLAERYAQRRNADLQQPSADAPEPSPVEASQTPVSQVEPPEDNAEQQEADAGEAPKKKKRRRRRKKKRPETAETAEAAESIEQPEQVMDDILEEEVAEEEDNQQELPESSEQVAEITEERTSSMSRANAQVSAGEGNLLGWFVNYKDDERGSATEVRAGRFFIGSEKVKPSDFVIADKSLSAPHCVVKADVEGGLQIQDLLSEEGTFIRKGNAGEGDYEPCLESTVLEHGDWVKFGDYEVLVCLLILPK